jgi:adenine-specific DNA-methyltransferase
MGKPGTKLARLAVPHGTGRHGVSQAALLESYSRELSKVDQPEDAYRCAIPLEHRKRFGQFFTPLPIAELMAEWVQAINPKTILDPAVGPGVFPRLLRKQCPEAVLTCIDVDDIALTAAQNTLSDSHNEFLRQDFLTWEDERLFDAAIANPPYLRHHDVHYPNDIFDLVGKRNRVRLSRLSNIYVLFILEICRRLRAGGRAAVIVPGEWVNANFGDTLKRWLVSNGVLHTLLYFSHASTQFDDALTTASILFLEKPVSTMRPDFIRTIFIQDGCSLDEIRKSMQGKAAENSNIVVQEFSPEELMEEKKWNHLLAHGLKEALPGFVALGSLAETRRGIATGCNSFFHLSNSAAQEFRIRSKNLTPCVGRAQDVAGSIFTEQDFNNLAANNTKTYLFDIKDSPDRSEAKYIQQGEAKGLHQRFLCAARNGHWYAMEKRPPSAIWATVFGRKAMRFIYNAARVANLTTFHCIYPKNESSDFAAALTACLNSRLVQQLAQRQHRVYGGGLLKMEPKDLLDIEVPDLRKVSAKTLRELAGLLKELDRVVRAKHDSADVQGWLDAVVEAAAEEAQEVSATCAH